MADSEGRSGKNLTVPQRQSAKQEYITSRGWMVFQTVSATRNWTKIGLESNNLGHKNNKLPGHSLDLSTFTMSLLRHYICSLSMPLGWIFHHTARSGGSSVAERRICDRKVSGSSPGRSGGEFSSPWSTFCTDSFRNPFHPRVTAVVSKGSLWFCQKCSDRLQLNTHASCVCGFE